MGCSQAAAFTGSMFGESLQTVMHQQAERYPELRVAFLLTQSAKAIIQLGGLNTAGIFLTTGDPDVVSEVRARFDRYQDGLNLVRASLHIPAGAKLTRYPSLDSRTTLLIRKSWRRCSSFGLENWRSPSYRTIYTGIAFKRHLIRI
jgi:hypothetical protein